ncbi:MAG TPA: hypothetical protein VG709_03200, partial [Actinomycetota bacterium]|nr:hypothetical protein [Actinomycetota bacterium]
MKRTALAAIVLASVGLVTPATAEDLPAVTSDNVEYLGTLTEDAATGAVSAKIVGKYLYVAGWRSFSIYEISDPARPVHQSTTPLGFQLYHEDVDSNGKILVLAENLQGPAARLHVWEVTNKQTPA